MKHFRNAMGRAHQVNGPAFSWTNGDYTWYNEGQCHRYYGPARCWNGDYDYYIFNEKIA